jgi:hypothetical protein
MTLNLGVSAKEKPFVRLRRLLGLFLSLSNLLIIFELRLASAYGMFFENRGGLSHDFHWDA